MNRKIDSDNNGTDTEGHMPFLRKVEDASENDTITDTDTEGHMPFVRKVEDASENDTITDTDTEGHVIRSGRAVRPKGVEEADTEGHAVRGKG